MIKPEDFTAVFNALGPILSIALKDKTYIWIRKTGTHPSYRRWGGDFILRYNDPSYLIMERHGHTYCLPYTDIEAISSIDVIISDEYDDLRSFDDEMHVRFGSYVFKHGYQIFHQVNHGAMDFDIKNPFHFRVASFESKCRLYADWDYIKRTTGGINAIGAGATVISASIGWETSLEKTCDKLMSSSDRISFCTTFHSKGIINGYIYLFANQFISSESTYAPHHDLKYKSVLTIEGSEWIPALISEKLCTNPKELNSTMWEYVYMKYDGFLMPLFVWNTINQKISIYVEKLPLSLSTDIGDRDYLYIARCAYFDPNN